MFGSEIYCEKTSPFFGSAASTRKTCQRNVRCFLRKKKRRWQCNFDSVGYPPELRTKWTRLLSLAKGIPKVPTTLVTIASILYFHTYFLSVKTGNCPIGFVSQFSHGNERFVVFVLPKFPVVVFSFGSFVSISSPMAVRKKTISKSNKTTFIVIRVTNKSSLNLVHIDI